MKTKQMLVGLLVAAFFGADSQLALRAAPQGQGHPDQKPPKAFIGERGPHHTVHFTVTPFVDRLGETHYRTNSYIELATGLNYLKNGQWTPTKAEIELTDDGAVASDGPHKVHFAANLHSPNAVDVTTPDGKRLRSHVTGLSYYDSSTGEAVLVAETKDSFGLLVGKNQIFYTNAFDGVDADVQYIYTKAGLEQNVILRAQPPSPEQFNLNPATTRLQVLTEFFNPPNPHKQVTPAKDRDSLSDETLDFGAMHIVPGRASLTGEQRAVGKSVSVSKEWVTTGDRTILIEQVPYKVAAQKTQGLSKKKDGASLQPKRRGKGENVMTALKDVLPKSLATASTRNTTIQLASADFKESQGFVIDYPLTGTVSNLTMKGDATYLISGSVNLIGTTIIEGGTVGKFLDDGEDNPTLSIYGPLDCQTDAYRPAVFTSSNDDTVGVVMEDSNGTPAINESFYISGWNSSGNTWNIHHLRMSYGLAGFAAYDTRNVLVRHCQFLNSPFSVCAFDGNMTIENTLFSNCGVILYTATNASLTHVTVDGFALLANSVAGFSSLTITNSLLIGTGDFVGSEGGGSLPTPILDHTPSPFASSAGLFQTVGAGSYYLAEGSTNRNAGTTAIDATLLADIRKRTTYPPIVFSNTTIAEISTLTPQAQRDTDEPDLGYHYDSLDYAFGGAEVSVDLTFAPGTAVAGFRTASAGQSMHIANLKKVRFDGRAELPNYFVRYNTVQEQSNGAWVAGAGVGMITGTASLFELEPEVKMRFTRCSAMSQDQNFFRDNSGVLVVTLQDSEFFGAGIGGYVTTIGMTNCMLHRVSVWLEGGIGHYFAMRNCTMRGSGLSLHRTTGGGPGTGEVPVAIVDCAFDDVEFIHSGDAHKDDPDWTRFDYNAYLTSAYSSSSGKTDPAGTHDVTVANFNWQTSWLGRYYLPTNSTLINTGSVANASSIGLYHFTSTTNQVKETTSQLNIGYHYVAVDGYGRPIDTDGDGMPDYFEDFNGNGVADDTTSWLEYNSSNGLSLGNGLIVFTPLK